MLLIAFKGATCYEFQICRVWIKLLRPRYWCRRNIRNLSRAGIDKEAR